MKGGKERERGVGLTFCTRLYAVYSRIGQTKARQESIDTYVHFVLLLFCGGTLF